MDKYCLDNIAAIIIVVICFTKFMSLICFFFVDSAVFIVGIATYPQEIEIVSSYLQIVLLTQCFSYLYFSLFNNIVKV